MAFTVEEISSVIAGDGSVSESIQQAAEKIILMYNEDVKGLKGTNSELKDEKKKMKEKHEAEIEHFAELEKEYQEKIRLAQEAAASNDSGEQKKYYDTQIQRMEEGYRTQMTLKDKAIAEKEALIAELQKKDLIRSQESEFMKEVQKTKADPLMYDVLKGMVLGQGDKFAQHDTPDGSVFWASDGSGETMKNRLDKILASDMGKHFVSFNSSGSGAEGSSGSFGATTENPFKTGNLTEQQRLYREDPKLYETLKRQTAR